MKHSHPIPVPVIEWSPNGARAFDPGTNQFISASSVGEAISAIGNPKLVGLAISRRQAFVRTIRLPDIPKSEAMNVLRLQLDRFFPLSGDDLCYDLAFQDDVSADGRQALVVASRVEVIRQALAAVQESGTKVAWVVPAALGSPLLAQDLNIADAVVAEETSDGLVLDVVHGGELTYSRVAPKTKSPEAFDAEVQRTLAAAKLAFGQLIVAGGLKVGSAAHSVEVPTLELLANRFDRQLNLQLPEVMAKQAKAKGEGRRRLAVLLWAATVAVAGMVYLDRDDDARKVKKAQETWKRELKRLQTNENLVTTRLGTSAENAEFLEKALEPKQYASDVVAMVVNQVPAGLWITGTNFERGRPLQIRGSAKTNDSVAQFVSRLSLSNRFRDVKLVFANNGKIDEQEVIQFAISAHVVGNLPLIEKKGGRS